MIIPINNAIAFSYVDHIKNGNYVFFLTDLEVDNNFEINITHTESGNFTLFLFNTRPVQSYLNNDNTLKEVIFNHSITYSLDDNPYINYTATANKIYYIEIILANGGPDTFFLTSTITYTNGTLIDKDLTRYYLPIIPGFSLEYLLLSLIIAFGIIIIIHKKKINK
jgi:hypothetical protein